MEERRNVPVGPKPHFLQPSFLSVEGISPNIPNRVNPLLRKVDWDQYSTLRLVLGSIIFSSSWEGATLFYCHYAHQNKIKYPGVIGAFKDILHNEGLNAFRASFPPSSIQSPLAKTCFIPIFECLRSKLRIPGLEADSNEEESIRTGVSAVLGSLGVFWLSRGGELTNLLNSKFHNIFHSDSKPFGSLSALPRSGSPYYSLHSQTIVFASRFFIPNMLWWPTYIYTKNIQSQQEDIDPFYGAYAIVAASALTATAVTTVGVQPIFYLRDYFGSKNIVRLFALDNESLDLLKANAQNAIPKYGRFNQIKQIIARFAIGAPVAVVGALTYEFIRFSFIDPKFWQYWSY